MEPPTSRPPTGTVTFLFSDIEGSTVRWDAHPAEMQDAVRRHDELMRAAIERNGGHIFKTIGDAFCAAFALAGAGVAAALDAQRAIGSSDWAAVGGLRVRMAMHAGVADERDADYFGPTVNRVARLLAVGHGGQVLLSGAAKDLANEVLPADATLLDLGMHRLKDLSAPEHVFQLQAPDLTVEFPSLRSLDALPNNLLGHLTPLVGREEELSQIEALLERSRLVTLIGTGGIGKTRTALQVAADLLRGDSDGVWFVDLSPLTDPMLVPAAIAEVFNVADEGGSRPLIERVGAALKAKRLLIVLDNCEQVITAAAEAAGRLLQVCPQIRILATSREPLGVAGEQCYRMPTLPVPPEDETTAEQVMQYAAAALFVARAQSAQHTFALTDGNAAIVADIVRRLDGIALAIELAAPRVKVLTVQQLDRRLDERFKLLTGGSRTAPSRQRTLHALIGWSYDLLTEAEQSLLRQCAIFRGGWTLEAAEAICVDERYAEWNAFDLLASLVDKSLVAVESDGELQRYRLLESTRQFALEKLTEADDPDKIAARHAGYFVKLALEAEAAYWETNWYLWIAQVRRELENFRAAIEWGFGGEGDCAAAISIFAGVRWLWSTVARREGRMLLNRASAAVSDETSAWARGRLALAAVKLESGKQSAAAGAEAVRLVARTDSRALVEAQFSLAQALGASGRLAETVVLWDETVTLARTTNTPRLIAAVLTSAAYWIGARGESALAHALYDEAAALLRACDDRRRLGIVQGNLAELQFAEGDPAGALANAREGNAVHREQGEESNLGIGLLNEFAYLLALGRLDEARAAVYEGLELVVHSEDAYLIAMGIGHVAHLAAEMGDVERAARLLGYDDTLFGKLDSVREPTEQRGYDRAFDLIRAVLTEDRTVTLVAEGAALDQVAAVAEALAIPQPPASQASRSA